MSQSKEQKKKYIPDLLPLNTIVEVIKIDLKGNFIGKKDIKYSEWKEFKKQKGFNYTCFQKGFSKFN